MRRQRHTRKNEEAPIAVRLEPCRDQDITHILHWVDSEHLMAFWAGATFRWPLSGAELHEYLQQARAPDSTMRVFRVVDAQTGAWIGHIDLCPSARNDGTAQIGRVLIGDPALRGRGIGRQMVGQVLDIAFYEMGMWRVDLYVARANAPARRCYRSLGFRRLHGVAIDRLIGQTKYPTIRMTIDRSTWERRRSLPKDRF